MIKQLYDLLLHRDVTRQTNLMMPRNDYVSYDTFPEQISELLNTEVTLKYRDQYIYENEILNIPATITKNGETVSSRPSDDVHFIERVPGPEAIEEDRIHTGLFFVLRADKELPNVFIAISKDFSKVIVSSTKKTEDDKYVFEATNPMNTIQFPEFIGLVGTTQYPGQLTEYKAYTIAMSNSEPMSGVVIEILEEEEETNTKLVRFVTTDESYFKITGAHNADLTVNELNKTNYAKYNRTFTKQEIVTYRKNVLEGIQIYGAI